MAKTVNEAMTAIADKIRENAGYDGTVVADKLSLDAMPDAIERTCQGRWQKGYTAGVALSDEDNKRLGETINNSTTKTLTENVDTVEQLNSQLEQILYGTDTGGKSHYDMFWDLYQDYGNRRTYRQAFSGIGWTDDIYNPKYDFIFDGKGNGEGHHGEMFFMSLITDTKKPMTIRFVGSTSVFYRAKVVTIREMNVTEAITYKDWFKETYELENITITGTIGNDIDFHYCKKLTRESILGNAATPEQITAGTNIVELNGSCYWGGILGALKDYSADTSGTQHILTLGADNLAKLSDEEKAIATQKGWTLA